jgi:F0F1-type ATP synthase membrane subunit b/b'
MSRALPKYNRRRVAIIGGAAAVVLSGAVIAGSALAGTPSGSSGNTARTLASPSTITCPDVASQLPEIPASAKAEVDRNVALLQTQIDEANKRLADTVGQGGPDFVQNAILGPLEDKRIATVNRIATAIGRTADKPQGLDALAPCTLDADGSAAGTGEETGTGDDAGTGEGATATPSATASASDGADDAAGESGNTGAGTITCPDVASQLPAVPASAKAEVDRNVALLQTQIDEANKRLASSVGEGGSNFVQNAILGPLADKRKSTIDRIAIAIGRTADKPTGLDSLAACTLTQ